jgi:hypothetical protein
MKPLDPRKRNALIWCLAVTFAVETLTIICRLLSGSSAAQFQAAHPLPLLFRIHHMFWGLVPLIVAAFFWRRPKLSGILIGLGLGLIFSDAIHHCIVSPLWFGNMSWHWP